MYNQATSFFSSQMNFVIFSEYIWEIVQNFKI